jgi:hypothetical protein
MEQYTAYCPHGKYNLYEVDIQGLDLDWNLPAGQARHLGEIGPHRIKYMRQIEL